MSAATVTVPDSIRELADLRRRVMVGTEAQRSAALHEYLSALIAHSRAKITELTAERDVLRVRMNEALALAREAGLPGIVRALTGESE